SPSSNISSIHSEFRFVVVKSSSRTSTLQQVLVDLP
ncbi:hypothetical protein A2U01_0099101, partial [Trifolium medium]|nr:hypothetical protein [Trifolium medium]